MSRIRDSFSRAAAQNRAAFIAYICAGDPNLDATFDIVLALEKAGVDIIELGIPFSDPLADGVVNQMAAQRALEAGTSVAGILDLIRRLRTRTQIPLVLFTYLNPIYIYGTEKFHHDASEAGADGILILDLPPDEESQNMELASRTGLDRIRLIAPTTAPERMGNICRVADGFIYYVSREGVTGEQSALAANLSAQVEAIRSKTSLPIAVGFGISNPSHVATVASVADGVVVGSAIVRRIAETGNSPQLAEKITDFVRPLVQATGKNSA